MAVQPPPTAWSPQFKRWLMRRYFEKYFVQPYPRNVEEAFVRLCSSTFRGDTYKIDGKMVMVRQAATDQECADIAFALFQKDHPNFSPTEAP